MATPYCQDVLLAQVGRESGYAASLEKKVYPVPTEIDEEIARLKLATMGVTIDTLTEEQVKYLATWSEGT